MLTMTITGRRLCWTGDGDPVTTGSVGYPVTFSFDAAWDGLTKVAEFRGSNQESRRALSEDATTIPAEVLTVPGSILWIGVRGENADGTLVIPTVWARIGYLAEGVGDAESPERELPPGGTAGQVLTKRSDEDYDAGWQDPQGSGGTDDYTALTNKPAINGHTLEGDQTAAQLGLYSKPAGGIPASDLAPGVIPSVPTAVSQLTNDSGYLTLDTLPIYDGGVT